MTAHPSPKQLQALFQALADVDTGQLQDRLQAAIKRDRSATNWPDGYPTSSGGNGQHGMPRRTVPEDEHGPQESVEFTGVECAVLDRQGVPKDDHRDLVNQACRALQDAVRAVDRLGSTLAQLDNLRADVGLEIALPGCSSCRRVGHFSSAAKEDNGRRGLCSWCYDFQRGYGQLPPTDIMDRHARSMQVTVAQVEAALGRKSPPVVTDV